MRWTRVALVVALSLGSAFLLIVSFAPLKGDASNPVAAERGDGDADLPARLVVEVNKQEYLSRRAEAVAMRRGQFDDPTGQMRARAVEMLNLQEANARQGLTPDSIGDSWISIGPAPIPNGSGLSATTPTSGRVISIAVHPTDPNIAYIGTAQGGLYRTTDGGVTWTALLDSGLSLAIGSLTLVPGDPTTLWVGTGECGFAADSYFGYGVYRIKTADTTPVVEGPFNKDTASPTTDLLTGRSVAGIAVDPNDPNVLYIGTGSAIGGVGGDVFGNAPTRGLFKSTNATSANPTFTKLAIGPISAAADQRVMDILFEPGSSSNMVISTVAVSGTLGGVWRTTNANTAAPTFTQTLSITNIPVASGVTRCELAQTKIAGVTTIYAASSENSGAATCGIDGTLRKSIDGGVTWSAPIAGGNGFCAGQCFYNIALDVNPTDAANVLLGGNVVGSCSKGIARSTNSGATFTNSPNVHADNHVVKFAPSNPLIVYEGNDGGIFKSTDGGVTFVSLNTSSFVATQFESIALHPTDRQFMIGGTQDNGTEYLNPAGIWTNADGGDGGFALIDKSGGADLENVNMYHTYFNATNVIGFARMTKASCIPTKDWEFRGACGAGANDPTPACDTTAEVLANGMTCGDNVEFYAPMALGPGTPNTLYYGTTKLYRSTDRGDTMPAVSQSLASTITAIGISPQNDNVRLVGTRAGSVFLTTTGSNPLTNVTGAIPPRYVARAVIDPNSSTTAYIALAGFGTTASPIQHVWKTTALSEGGTTWTAASNGLPDIPVNGFAVDVNDSVHPGVSVLYAGTDIGVYTSTDGGANWVPYGTGLPRVAVFDMAIQSPNRVLRIATHGRGIWEIGLPGTTLGGGATPTATPTATATATPTATATATPTATATSTPSATATSTPSATATSTPSATATSTPTATATSTPSATATSTPTATATSTPSATATSTPTATATSTPSATATSTPTATATSTPTATATSTPTATATATPTATATATPTATPAQAVNLSTRLRVELGDKLMIGGFIVTGSAPKKVFIRGMGPSLAGMGVSDFLADPFLELRRSDGTLVQKNDNWKDDQRPEIEGTIYQPTDDRESVIVATLNPGAYTALLTGKGANPTGVGLVEIYDGNVAASSQLANISTRGFVQTQANVLIGGFTLSGNSPGNVAFRGVGPSLTQFGLSNVLADPVLEVHNSNGTVMITNDDWTDDSASATALTIRGLGLSNSKESGIFISLAPGQYTVTLTGKSGGTGIGLVEIYRVN